MLLNGKVAVIFGAGGAVGGAVARQFAEERATVFLSGRTSTSVQDVQREIVAKGSAAHAAQVERPTSPTSRATSPRWPVGPGRLPGAGHGGDQASTVAVNAGFALRWLRSPQQQRVSLSSSSGWWGHRLVVSVVIPGH